jgi:uncharacterized membrane protein
MTGKIVKWFKLTYRKVVNSIAFLPAVIALLFLVLSYVMIVFDFSDTGKQIKSSLHWLSLKDASTARSICSAIAGGIISLAVFSFSMVMILLNQAASQMSNRILGKLIGNRFQQIILGFYIGTIIYALFLLSTIRDINTGIYVPAISTYLLIALTIIDIFLFIYFLHYITDSVKYETIIHRIYFDTKNEIQKSCVSNNIKSDYVAIESAIEIRADQSGLYQGIEKNSLLTLCQNEDVIVSFLYPPGIYVLKGTPIALVETRHPLSKDFEQRLLVLINIARGQDITVSYYYGFSQLSEIALKALSPGINDPATAAMSLHVLGDLLAFRLDNPSSSFLKDTDNNLRIIINEKTFDVIFEECIVPIWDYGKNDRLIQREMSGILSQLKTKVQSVILDSLLDAVHKKQRSNTFY